MDNGVEIRKKKKKGLPKGWRREEKKKIKEMERDISCMCVVSFLCVWKSRSKKHIRGDGGGCTTPPFSTVLNCCVYGRKEEEVVIYHDSCLVCCLAKNFYVRKMCALRFNFKYKSNIFSEKVFWTSLIIRSHSIKWRDGNYI